MTQNKETIELKPEFVSTIENVTGEKVDMYRINGEGKTLCTLGVPHGDKRLAKNICDAWNTRADHQAPQDLEALRLIAEDWFYAREGDVSVCDKVCPILYDFVSHLAAQGHLTTPAQRVDVEAIKAPFIKAYENACLNGKQKTQKNALMKVELIDDLATKGYFNSYFDVKAAYNKAKEVLSFKEFEGSFAAGVEYGLVELHDTLLKQNLTPQPTPKQDEWREVVDTLHSTLFECLDYLDGKADADFMGDECGYMPNDEMRLQQDIEEALIGCGLAIKLPTPPKTEGE